MARTLPTDFEDEVLQESGDTAVGSSTAKDEAGVPYCVKHHCRMKQTSGGKRGSAVAYYACPVDGCEEKEKRIKTSKPIIPAEPHICPRCSPKQIMNRDASLSNMMYTILRCPACGYKSAPMPRPEFVANHAKARGQEPIENIGQR